MATHVTCDGCNTPIDPTIKDQDKIAGRVTVYRGQLVIADAHDLCSVCLDKAAAAVAKIRMDGNRG